MNSESSKPDPLPPVWVLWLIIIAIIIITISCFSESSLTIPIFSTNRPPIDFTAGGSQAYYYTNTYCYSYTMSIVGNAGDYEIEWSIDMIHWHPLWPVYTKHNKPLIIVVPSPTNYPVAFFRLKQVTQ